ncbi:hypothetical protein AVEN_150290-1 [Araneus ventricosus]|uniref:Uncharacterized protein n=1 Tax=Araneus ventricosus TaxID=182803 RepID=A0A4Y2TBC6_ARAVE|nr:hypothetical protein AVEN_113566-1 [Araneus ventricosus]GBN97948.1 hypothetical protein AVEN_173063-1 [Araneus ventricosus]GBN97970.1 hypothetical protein AVEN_180340-1 [Araneus ventricosus]GBN98007.1 hypothetical protein AVEN_150290-1 [Araneus ventricosus]
MELYNEEENYNKDFPVLPQNQEFVPPTDQISSQQQDVNQPKLQAAEKRVNVLPIIIYNPTNAAILIKSFNDITDTIVEGKMIDKDRLKDFPSSADAHRKIEKEINKKIEIAYL